MRWVGHDASMEEREREREVHTGFWWGNLRGRDHMEVQNVDGRMILKRTWDLHKMRGICWLAEDLFAS